MFSSPTVFSVTSRLKLSILWVNTIIVKHFHDLFSLSTLFPNSLSSYSQTWLKSVSEKTKEYLHRRSLWTNSWQAMTPVWVTSLLVSPHLVCPMNTSSFGLHGWPVWWFGGIQLSDHLRSPDLMHLPEKQSPLMHSLSPCLHRVFCLTGWDVGVPSLVIFRPIKNYRIPILFILTLQEPEGRMIFDLSFN